MDLQKHIRYSVLFLAIATISQTTIAKTYKHDYKNYKAEPCTASPFDGAYVGFGVGSSTFFSQSTNHFTINGATDDLGNLTEGNIITSLNTNDVYNYAVMGNIFFGFGKVLTYGLYAGLQAGVNFYDSNHTTMTDYDSISTYTGAAGPTLENITQYQANTTASRNVAEPFLDLKLGFLLHENAMIYAKGGINYTKTGVKSQNSIISTAGDVDTPSLAYTTIIQNSDKDYGIGYRAGVGTEYMVTSNISLAIDYVYTFYPTRSTGTIEGAGYTSFCNADECSLAEATTANAGKARISDQQVVAQLIYHFDTCCN